MSSCLSNCSHKLFSPKEVFFFFFLRKILSFSTLGKLLQMLMVQDCEVFLVSPPGEGLDCFDVLGLSPRAGEQECHLGSQDLTQSSVTSSLRNFGEEKTIKTLLFRKFGKIMRPCPQGDCEGLAVEPRPRTGLSRAFGT